jgi:hypothetical protein
MNFLPGWHPGFIASARRLSTISQVLSSGSSAATIAAPSGIQAGDLIVLADAATSIGSTPALVTPSGFTNLTNASDANDRMACWYKLADGTEGGASYTGMSGGSQTRKVMAVFRGDIPAISITPADADSGAFTSGDPASQIITSASGAPPLVVCSAYYGTTGSISPRSFTPAKDGEVNPSGSTALYLAWKIYNAAPADVTVDMGDHGVNCLQSFYMRMT